jgi:hypothetical protein
MSNVGYVGPLDERSNATDFETLSFLISQRMSRLATSMLVKVVAVTNSGGVSPVGFVDVQPMVHQIDGMGQPTPHGIIHGLPYSRLQGGTNAVILDPVVGDIGVAVFCSRDTSRVRRTKIPDLPGSRRRFSLSDGVYVGGVLNGTPTQYVQFTTSGITVVSPTKVTIQAPDIELQGDTTVTGTLTATVDVVANGISVHTHHHGGVQTGTGATGGPE